MENHRFDGRVALVTGGGNGLGRQHALELARRGAKVVINDLRRKDGSCPAETVAGELRAEGCEAIAVAGNMGLEADVDALIQRAIDVHGRLDILVNNAGNSVGGPFWAISTADFASVINVHVYGMFWAMRAALPHMRQAGYGRIVNTASALGAFGAPQSAPYVTAKAAVIGLSRVAALDNADQDIRVNAVAPIAYTGLAKGFFDARPDVNVDKLTTELVSPAVLYLCHESCALNGELLSVAAGRVARIFTATAPGYYDAELTSEKVAANLAPIMDPAGYMVPTNSMDQYKLLKLK